MFEKNRILQMLEQNQIPLGMQCFTGAEGSVPCRRSLRAACFNSVRRFVPEHSRAERAP